MSEYIKKFLHRYDQAIRLFRIAENNRPLNLSCKKHLAKFVLLPYSAQLSHIITLSDISRFYDFYNILSYGHVSGGNTSSDMFGVGEIIIDKNIDQQVYPLPIYFPEKKCFEHERRRFSFQTKSGNDLIYSLSEPGTEEYSEYSHHVFCFGTDNKQWSRIVSIEKDGTYIRKQISTETDSVRLLPNSDKDAYIVCPYEDIIVWSNVPGKIWVEIDESKISDGEFGSSQNIYHRHERVKANENIVINNFLSYRIYDEPLELRNLIKSEIRILYNIWGIKNFFINQILSSEEKRER